MLETNERQRAHYESGFDASEGGAWGGNGRPGRATIMWSRLRDAVLGNVRRMAGVDDALFAVHRAWMTDIDSASVLDLGCFKGNVLSLWLVQNARHYVAMDLSPKAIDHLAHRITASTDKDNWAAIAGDFLENDFPDASFDIVYAYSVLHHFHDLPVALVELRRVVKPGGLVISTDPLATDPLNRFLRLLYRPMQSDREWEFPFTRKTFGVLSRYFDITDTVGSQGLVKVAYPLLSIRPLRHLGEKAAKWGLSFDLRRTRDRGLALWLCWHVSLRMTRPHK